MRAPDENGVVGPRVRGDVGGGRARPAFVGSEREARHQERRENAHRKHRERQRRERDPLRRDALHLAHRERREDRHRRQPRDEVVVVAASPGRQRELDRECDERDREQHGSEAPRCGGVHPRDDRDDRETGWQRQAQTGEDRVDAFGERCERGVGAVVNERLIDHVAEDTARGGPGDDERERHDPTNCDEHQWCGGPAAEPEERNDADRDDDPDERRFQQQRGGAKSADAQGTRSREWRGSQEKRAELERQRVELDEAGLAVLEEEPWQRGEPGERAHERRGRAEFAAKGAISEQHRRDEEGDLCQPDAGPARERDAHRVDEIHTRRLVVPDVTVRRAAVEEALRGVKEDAGVLGRIAAGGMIRQENSDRHDDEQRDRDDSDAHRATDSLILCADAATGRDRGRGRCRTRRRPRARAPRSSRDSL